MTDVVIAGAVRTAIGAFMGSLSGCKATELGGIVVKSALQRANVPASAVNEVIMGHVLQAGCGQNPARQALIAAGLSTSLSAVTINKVCGSGLKAVMLAAQAIKAGDADVIVAGGMESMSNAPHFIKGVRNGLRLGHGQLTDSLVADGLWDCYHDYHMGNTAELVADKYKVSRAEQDNYALESHRRASAAIDSGAFKAEITPVRIPQKKGDALSFEADEGPRRDSSPESLAKLKPVFMQDGSVTAGNASTINDGAAALVIMSAAKAKALGVKPLARITGYAAGGMDPQWVMMAPIEALKNLREKTGVDARRVDLVELNEAFSVQSVALLRELELDAAQVNVNGGAVALGHPIGCSGARVLVTLLYALQQRNLRTGVVSLCLGGGNAVALGVERS